MAWSLLDSGTASFTDGNTGHVFSFPAGAASQGDLLVLGVNSDTTVSTPSGYTLSANASHVGNQGAYVFWQVAGASPPSSVTITTSGNFSTCLSFLRYSGGQSSPFDVAANAAADSSAGSATPSLSIGPLAGSGELLLAFGCLHGSNAGAATGQSWSGGPSDLVDPAYSSANQTQQFAGGYTTASGTVSPSVSWTNSFNDRYIIAVAFLPAASTVSLTAPNLALAAPLVSVEADSNVSLTAPNLALAAPLVTPQSNAVQINLTAPNLALRAPLLGVPAAGGVVIPGLTDERRKFAKLRFLGIV